MSAERIKAALAELSDALGEHVDCYDSTKAPDVRFEVRWVGGQYLEGRCWLIPEVRMDLERTATETFSP